MSKTTKKGARFGAYHRVSQLSGRDPEAVDYITEVEAWEQIDGWAKMRRVQVAERYLDRDVSGSKMDRPELNRMLADLRAGRIDGIAVAKVDRLSRADVSEALRVVAEINEIAPGQLAILDLGIDPATDTGELLLGILLHLAHWQWKRYRAQWRSARARALGRGWHLGRLPYGYTREPKRNEAGEIIISEKTGKPKGTGPLIPDPVEGPIVTEIYERRAAGEPWAAIRDALQDRGIRTRTGQPWIAGTLATLIRSQTYLGIASGGHGGDEPVKGAHPALIDEATWHAAQSRRSIRADQRTSRTLTRGLVRCASCRYAMQIQHMPNGDFAYRCSRQYDANDCPDPSGIVAASNGHLDLDRFVIKEMWKRGEADTIKFEAIDRSLEELRRNEKNAEDELRKDARDPDLERVLGRAMLLERLAMRRAEFDTASAALKEALHASGRRGRSHAELTKEWETMSMEARRNELALAVRYVFVRPPRDGVTPPSWYSDDESRHAHFTDRVHIVWTTDPDDIEVPRQGRPGYVIKPFVFPDSHPADVRVAAA